MPTLRETRVAIFFALLSLLGVAGWVREGNAAVPAVAIGLTLAASWLAYRGRLFGNPTLVVDPQQVRLTVGGREISAAWRDVERVSFGPYRRHEIWLVRRDGPPIRFSDSMTTADGERFDMVFDDYLEAPKTP
jgi:hypothetical protein